MTEQETLAGRSLAEVICDWHEPRGVALRNGEPFPCFACTSQAASALSWLASVLADDATVEVCTDALPGAERARYRGDLREQAQAVLAALSAHLSVPVPGGVAARKQEAGS